VCQLVGKQVTPRDASCITRGPLHAGTNGLQMKLRQYVSGGAFFHKDRRLSRPMRPGTSYLSAIFLVAASTKVRLGQIELGTKPMIRRGLQYRNWSGERGAGMLFRFKVAAPSQASAL
jgi:hypothetical protein